MKPLGRVPNDQLQEERLGEVDDSEVGTSAAVVEGKGLSLPVVA